MQQVTLYSTGCPRCTVLKSKLDAKRIQYSTVSDEDELLSLGIVIVPVLSVDGERMSFMEAVRWINDLEDSNEH